MGIPFSNKRKKIYVKSQRMGRGSHTLYLRRFEMILFDFFKCDQKELLNAFCSYFDLSVSNTKEYLDMCDWSNTNVVDVIRGLNIDLSKSENQEVYCVGCHVSTTTQNGISQFRQNGVFNLAQMLSQKNDLTCLLASNSISIDYDNKTIEVGGNTYTLDFDSGKCRLCLKGNSKTCGTFSACRLKKKLQVLKVKLYEYSATAEFFISGTLDEMKRYSTVSKCPEILYTLDELLCTINNERRTSMATTWEKDHPICIAIKFIANIEDMETFNPMDWDAWFREYGECILSSGFTSDDFYMGQIPKKVFENFYIVNKFVSFYSFGSSEDYGSLLPDLYIPPSQILAIDQI